MLRFHFSERSLERGDVAAQQPSLLGLRQLCFVGGLGWRLGRDVQRSGDLARMHPDLARLARRVGNDRTER